MVWMVSGVICVGVDEVWVVVPFEREVVSVVPVDVVVRDTLCSLMGIGLEHEHGKDLLGLAKIQFDLNCYVD